MWIIQGTLVAYFSYLNWGDRFFHYLDGSRKERCDEVVVALSWFDIPKIREHIHIGT
jgi:hypothetical protein